jgi:hypothetical protein
MLSNPRGTVEQPRNETLKVVKIRETTNPGGSDRLIEEFWFIWRQFSTA